MGISAKRRERQKFKRGFKSTLDRLEPYQRPVSYKCQILPVGRAEGLLHGFLHNRLHLILYGISGFDHYLIVYKFGVCPL
jgi:hypothetical protein